MTEQKFEHRAALDTFRVALTDALRPLTDSIEIQETAARVLGESLGANRVIYIEVASAGEEVIVYKNYASGVAELSGHYRLEDYRRNLSADHQLGQTQIVTDIPGSSAYTEAEKARYSEIEIAAHIDVPLIKNNQFVALLAVHQASSRQWTEDEIEQVEETAERTWAAVERARTEAALQASEAKYRTLFNSIDQGFCVCELIVLNEACAAYDYRILETNPTFAALTGLEQAIGRTGSELIPGLEPFWYETYARVVQTGESIRFESYLQAWNCWFDVYVTPIGIPQDQQFAVLFNNITDRKLAEVTIATDLKNTRLLRDLSARLRTEDNVQVLYDEIVAAAIAITQADAGTVQILDETTQEILLLAAQGFDHTITDYFYRVDACSNTSCGVAMTTGTRAIVDFDVPEDEDPHGSLRLLLDAGFRCAQSTPLISRSGKEIGMVSTHWRKSYRPSDRELRFLDLLARQAADLIEQRQIEVERQQSLQREQTAREVAERANRLKDEFLAVLSHELRSPLNPILGWTRILQNGNLDATRSAEALKTIERNAKLQSQLIEDLLDISRIMQGKLSLTAASVNLAFVIAAAVETVQLAAAAKNIQIILDLDSEVAQISGDPARLQQVVWNLLTNAVKFTPYHGQVTVELRQLDHLAQIRVSDTGKGINPQFLPYVFEYFRQEDGSTTRKFGGLGLGLAIVRQIVELHGGTVWVESRGEGQGAAFTVQFPVMLQAPPVMIEPSCSQTETEAPLTNFQILLVDDEVDTREFQAYVLEQSGAKVKAVASALEALQVLEQFIPDVLVSDIGMAEMDGYMLIERIRSRSAHQGGMVPALALTAYATDIDQQKALQAGFHTHLTKPVDPGKLVQAIVTLLQS